LALSFIVWKRETNQSILKVENKQMTGIWLVPSHLVLCEDFFVAVMQRRLVISVAYRLPKWPPRFFMYVFGLTVFKVKSKF